MLVSPRVHIHTYTCTLQVFLEYSIAIYTCTYTYNPYQQINLLMSIEYKTVFHFTGQYMYIFLIIFGKDEISMSLFPSGSDWHL